MKLLREEKRKNIVRRHTTVLTIVQPLVLFLVNWMFLVSLTLFSVGAPQKSCCKLTGFLAKRIKRRACRWNGYRTLSPAWRCSSRIPISFKASWTKLTLNINHSNKVFRPRMCINKDWHQAGADNLNRLLFKIIFEAYRANQWCLNYNWKLWVQKKRKWKRSAAADLWASVLLTKVC